MSIRALLVTLLTATLGLGLWALPSFADATDTGLTEPAPEPPGPTSSCQDTGIARGSP